MQGHTKSGTSTLWIVIHAIIQLKEKKYKSSPVWNTSLFADATVRTVLQRNLSTFCGFFSRVPLIWNLVNAQEVAITANKGSKERVRNASCMEADRNQTVLLSK